LIDSGCAHTCINKETVIALDIPVKELENPIEVINVDRTKNKKGWITDKVDIDINLGRHKETLEAVVSNVESADVFLGYDWLLKHNPEINWDNG
ncbi:hypothetical protein P691DRAFT_649800, partial [Macrolepiota fuliginosa MF-IS2]